MADFDATQSMKIYHSWNLSRQPFTEKRKFISYYESQSEKLTHVANLRNRNVRYLRIDPLPGKGRLKIYSVEIKSHFGDALFWDAEQIIENFSPNSVTTMHLQDGGVEINSTGSDPQMVLMHPVKFSNPLFGIVLPIFLSVLTTLVVKSIRLREIYAIKDINNKKPSSTQNIRALDGLRGFAALLVFADHIRFPYFAGLGVTGVWIFYCLSGFLLSIPFVNKPNLISSSGYLQHYLLRRIKRILPMYYFVLTIIFFFRGDLDSFIRHILFIQGDGVFWTIPQEMIFYMILPLVFLLNFYLCRGKATYMLLSTLTMAILLNHYVSIDWLYTYGNGKKMPLWLGVFMLGVSLSYFYHSPYADFLKRRPKLLHDLFGLVLLGIVLLSSDGFLELVLNIQVNWLLKAQILVYIAALLLIFTISHERCLLGRLISWFPLRAVGIVGFSFYLLHPSVLSALDSIFLKLTDQKPGHLTMMAIGLILTYFCSVITYSLIERPFMRKQ